MKSRLIIAVLAFSLAAFSPAPIGDKGNLKQEPERSQAVVTQEQARYQDIQGQTGEVPIDTEPDFAGGPEGSIEGAHALAAAGNQSGASQVLAEASKPPSGGFNWFLVVIVGLAGFGAVWAIRHWIDKTTPVPAGYAARKR